MVMTDNKLHQELYLRVDTKGVLNPYYIFLNVTIDKIVIVIPDIIGLVTLN